MEEAGSLLCDTPTTFKSLFQTVKRDKGKKTVFFWLLMFNFDSCAINATSVTKEEAQNRN